MTVDQQAKNKLAKLMAEVQPVIDQNISEMSGAEVEYILTNFKNYLRIDLERDLKKHKTDYSSPFDDLLNDLE